MHDAILVVAEAGRFEPQRAVRLVHVAGLLELLDALGGPAVGVERSLRGPHVEAHAEVGEAALDARANLLGRPGTDYPARLRFVGLSLLRYFCWNFLGDLADVFAVVAILGNLLPSGQRQHRLAELLDLAARVVEVVLARDLLAGRLEDAAQQIADERAAGIANGQRAGRIGADELDVDALRFVRLAAAVVETLPRESRRLTARHAFGLSQTLTKPGPATSARAMRPSAARLLARSVGDVARRPPQVARRLHRQVGRVVAMLDLLRPHDLDDLRLESQRGLRRCPDLLPRRDRASCSRREPNGCLPRGRVGQFGRRRERPLRRRRSLRIRADRRGCGSGSASPRRRAPPPLRPGPRQVNWHFGLAGAPGRLAQQRVPLSHQRQEIVRNATVAGIDKARHRLRSRQRCERRTSRGCGSRVPR